jgi:hypothetical protein
MITCYQIFFLKTSHTGYIFGKKQSFIYKRKIKISLKMLTLTAKVEVDGSGHFPIFVLGFHLNTERKDTFSTIEIGEKGRLERRRDRKEKGKSFQGEKRWGKKGCGRLKIKKGKTEIEDNAGRSNKKNNKL